MIKFGIIVLNYMAWKETILCVNSFLNEKNKDYVIHIVVVDNGSDNNSYSEIMKAFENNNNVDVLHLAENKGFAKGNNEGLFFLKEKYDCDFYIFSNSDIIVNAGIFDWIINTFNETNCNLLGPDIYAEKMKLHQNPIKTYTASKVAINLKIIKKTIEIKLYKIMSFLNICVKCKSSNISLYEESNINMFYDVTLHGAFIVTDKEIFKYYKDFFDPRTFLYMEEHFLYRRCVKSKLKTLVSLDYQVIHLQGASTDKDERSFYRKKINRLEKDIASMKLFRDAL